MFIAALTYEYYHTGGLGFQQNLGGGGWHKHLVHIVVM